MGSNTHDTENGTTEQKPIKVRPEVADLIDRIKAHILEEPKRFDMRYLAYRYGAEEDTTPGGRQLPMCKTVACIAGWAVLLTNPEEKWTEYNFHSFTGKDIKRDCMDINVWRKGAQLLDLDPTSTGCRNNPEEKKLIARDVFEYCYWPDEFRNAYHAAENRDDLHAMAVAACNRLDHYKFTGE